MYHRTTLDNGLRILTESISYSQSVSILISVGAGSRYEPPELAGLSHFLEHLPFKGTERWPTAQLVSEAIEGVGGIMNASTDREMTVFWCKVAKPHYKQALSVLLDMILHPNLDPREMEKEREVIEEELRMTYDYPSQMVDLLIDDLLWPEQSMGRDVGGTIETINNISIDDVREYMGHQYNPNNTVISVVGAIEHSEITDLVNEEAHNWTPRSGLDWERVILRQSGPIVKIDNRPTDQSHICLGMQGLSLFDPDRFALPLLNCVLGDGMSSRLFLRLREDQGLAYDVSSSANNFKDCGSLIVYCGTEPKKVQAAIKSIMSEINSLLTPINESELKKAKEYTKGRLLLRMEDTRAIASWLGTQELLMGRILNVAEVVNLIDQTDVSDIHRVATRLLSEPNMRLALVGPHDNSKMYEPMIQIP